MKHGYSGSTEYFIWCEMKQRCFNPKHRAYADYGGRGIRVCKRWMDPKKFIEDMGPRRRADLSIDRRNNDGHYTPSNCYWATPKQQQRNKRKRMKSTNMGRPVSNKYGVPKKQWSKWSNTAKRMFNRMFYEMRHQWVYLHPDAPVLSREHWKTVRWNVAWIAANAADKIPARTHIITLDSRGREISKRKLRK